MNDIKSTAAKILSTGEPTEDEARRLAGYVLSDASPERINPPTHAVKTPDRSTKPTEELLRMLKAGRGVTGYKQRNEAIEAELALRKAEGSQ